MNYYKYIKSLVFLLNEETAHNLSICALKHGLLPRQPIIDNPILRQNIWGLDFINPIGLAAGYDKNAQAIPSLTQQGFGFIETGTVTPEPQKGNPKPRIFRLPEDEAIINRMGFNNKGRKYYAKNLRKWQKKRNNIIIGANIGKNKNSPNNPEDYLTMLDNIYGLSDYITINISSPNTPNLREMQKNQALDVLLHTISEQKNKLREKTQRNIPILLKIAPDMNDEQCQDIAKISLKHQIDGLIVSNTTTGQRSSLKNTQHHTQQGGLSGKPLFTPSNDILQKMYQYTDRKIPIIAAGGISNAQDAYQKIKNGASLVQIYSALIYQGFELTTQINQELAILLKSDGYHNIEQAVGANIKA